MSSVTLWQGAVEQQTVTIRFNSADLLQSVHLGIDQWVTEAPHVFIEGVEFWSGSAVSMASASRGDLSQLAYIVGVMASVAIHHCNTVEIISPKDWKGQLSYTVLRKHLSEHFGIETKNEHNSASIGMGLWLLGKL